MTGAERDDDLRRLVLENTEALREYAERTDLKIESIIDTVTRIAHATEDTRGELTSHKAWEEDYHRSEVVKQNERHQQLADRIDRLHEDLSLYFKTKNTARNVGDFAAWLAKLGIVGALFLWLWGVVVQPFLRKVGLF